MERVIRSDQWKLKPAAAQQPHLHASVALFRARVDLLEGVVYTHWPELMRAPSICHAVEQLIHATKKNPHPRYPQFDRRFRKFPSCLRRAAIEFVVGQVSSFISNYDRWQAGIRLKKDAKPPRRGCRSDANPALYRGQMIKFHDGYKTAEIKVWNGHDWVWEKMPLVGHRQRHTVSTNKQLCPSLILNGARAKPAAPFRIKRMKLVHQEAVCAADLGINTTAVAGIVQADGTVVARRFIHPAADIDRRDKSPAQIRHKAHLTGRLSEGFCKGLYAKGRRRNLQIACDVARELLAFAKAHQVTVIVFEYLKKFRPKGGRRDV